MQIQGIPDSEAQVHAYRKHNRISKKSLCRGNKFVALLISYPELVQNGKMWMQRENYKTQNCNNQMV